MVLRAARETSSVTIFCVACCVQWGAATSEERGPVLATNTNMGFRNAIGAHSGSYSIYRALAVAAGALDPVRGTHGVVDVVARARERSVRARPCRL